MSAPFVQQPDDVESILSAEPPPLPDDATNEEKEAHWYEHVYQGDRMPQLTVRAVIMGGFLGMLMSVSNLYTTLKVGWAFGVAITACVMSWVIWNAMRAMTGRRLGQMTILENTCMASTASAAGYSTGSTLATMFGALLILSADPKNPNPKTWEMQSIWVVGSFTLCTAALGVFLAIPMKRQMINREQLPFPSGIAAATTLRALYSHGKEAVRKAYALIFGVFTGAVVGVMNSGDTSYSDAMPIADLKPGATIDLVHGGVIVQADGAEQAIEPGARLVMDDGVSLVTQGGAPHALAHDALVNVAGGGVLHRADGAAQTLVSGAQVTLEKGAQLVPKPPGLFHWIEQTLFGKLPELMPKNGFAQLKPTGQLVNAVKDGHVQTAVGLKLPGFGFEPSALLIAAGMIVGLRVSLTMAVGSCLLYFFVGPWIVGMDNQSLPADDLHRAVKIVGGGSTFQIVHWALWGGTAVMVFSSLTAVALQWKVIARSFTALKRGGSASAQDARIAGIEVPFGWLIAGLVPITIAMLFVQYIAFKINVAYGLIAVAMSFVLSLVACRATGETDTTPIGAMGKVMQLLFALLSPHNIQHNLASAGVAANSASASADLLTDLKSGYLLGANPRKQFIAQFIGVFFGCIAIVPAWYLMVPDKHTIETYPLPATQQWVAVAKVLTQGIESLPVSAQWAILIGALVGVSMPLVEWFLPRKARKYMPSAMGLGLSWIMPFNNAFAFGIGAVIAWIWSLVSKKNADRYNIPLASGLIAGESLLKALIAMSATAVGLLAATKGGG